MCPTFCAPRASSRSIQQAATTLLKLKAESQLREVERALRTNISADVTRVTEALDMYKVAIPAALGGSLSHFHRPGWPPPWPAGLWCWQQLEEEPEGRTLGAGSLGRITDTKSDIFLWSHATQKNGCSGSTSVKPAASSSEPSDTRRLVDSMWLEMVTLSVVACGSWPCSAAASPTAASSGGGDGGRGSWP